MSPSAAFTAIAASTALPPALRISTPISTASGCAAHTMPLFAIVSERDASIFPAGLSNAEAKSGSNAASANTMSIISFI